MATRYSEELARFKFKRKEYLSHQERMMALIKRFQSHFRRYGVTAVDVDNLCDSLRKEKKHLEHTRALALEAKKAYERASGKKVKAGWDRNK